MTEIPLVPDVPFYDQRVILEGVEYTLDVVYNQREDRWYVSLLRDDGTAILQGAKVVPNVLLFRKIRYRSGLPSGDLMFLNESENAAPGLSDLGVTTKLYYFTEAERDALS